MKKFFKHTALLLAILSTGTIVTSCNEDTLTYVFNIISNFINTGQNYIYTGSASSQTLQGQEGSMTASAWRGDYVNKTDDNPTGAYNFSGMKVTLTTGNTAQIVIPAYQEGNVSLTDITISDLSLTSSADQKTATIDLTESSMIDGTLTYNNVNYPAGNLYIEKAVVTETQLELSLTIFFAGSTEGEYPMATNFTFQGTLPTTN